MNSTELFSKTSPLKLFFIASIPGAISMFASALYYTIEGIFVGHYLGSTAFAALNLALPFVIINFSLADLIGVGSSVPISIYLGKGKRIKADNIFTCACIMILLAGIIIGGVLYFSAPLLIRLMGADGDFARHAVQYLRVYALCSPLTTILFAVDNYLRICGYIRGSLFINIFMSLLCTVLEFIFLGIFGWGIWGAALGTCLGMATCSVIAFIPFFRGKALLHFRKPIFSLKMIRRIIACGSPNFLNNIAGRLTSIILNFILVRMGGETAVSVYGILMFAEGLIQPLLYGMCDALQPAVGYNFGAGKYSRVRAIEKCCFTSSAVISFLAVILIFSLPELLTRLFVPDPGPDIIKMSVFALRLFAFTYVTRWISFATQSFMLAIGNPKPATVISVSTAIVFPVILIVVLSPLGLTGIWMIFAATAFLSAVLALIILKRNLNKVQLPDTVA